MFGFSVLGFVICELVVFRVLEGWYNIGICCFGCLILSGVPCCCWFAWVVFTGFVCVGFVGFEFFEVLWVQVLFGVCLIWVFGCFRVCMNLPA